MTTNRQPVGPIIKGDDKTKLEVDAWYARRHNASGLFYELYVSPSVRPVAAIGYDYIKLDESIFPLLFAAAEQSEGVAMSERPYKHVMVPSPDNRRIMLPTPEPAKDQEPIHTCGDCGQELTLVRPGKYQCDNELCPRNLPEPAVENDPYIAAAKSGLLGEELKERFAKPAYPKDTLTKDDKEGWYFCQCIPAPCLDGDLVRWWDGENLRSDRRSLVNLASYTNFRPLTDATESGERIAELEKQLHERDQQLGLHAIDLGAAEERAAESERRVKELEREKAMLLEVNHKWAVQFEEQKAELAKLKAGQGGELKRYTNYWEIVDGSRIVANGTYDTYAVNEDQAQSLTAAHVWCNPAMRKLGGELRMNGPVLVDSPAPPQSANGDGLGDEAVEQIAGLVWKDLKYGAQLSWDILFASLRSHLPAPQQVEVVVGPTILKKPGTLRIKEVGLRKTYYSSHSFEAGGEFELSDGQIACYMDTEPYDKALREYKPKAVVSERHRSASYEVSAAYKNGGCHAVADKLAELFPEAQGAGA